MRNLIIGIIAVIMVDIGFVTYVKNDNAADTTLAAVDTDEEGTNLAFDSVRDLAEAPELAEQESLPDDATIVSKRDEIAALNFAERRKGKAEFELRAVKKDRRLPTRGGLHRSPDIYALLKPIKIEIPNKSGGIIVKKELTKTPSVVRLADISEHMAKHEPKPDNKSFVAIVLPVIKKPWDWIRAIGSKLR